MPPRTCVSPDGTFIVGLHRPCYQVRNLRTADRPACLGRDEHGQSVGNSANYPEGNLDIAQADPIFEIANPFPFRGTTYIGKRWADGRAAKPESIRLPQPEGASLCCLLRLWFPGETDLRCRLAALPLPLLQSLAASAAAPDDLVLLAGLACDILHDEDGKPEGLVYRRDAKGRLRPCIHHEDLFETVVNNPHLPNEYKIAMVLRPGVQGDSPIVGEIQSPGSHVYEYLRANSYIPWGHYAANMAEDQVRYAATELSAADMTGLRHLYYQRTFCRLADGLGLDGLPVQRTLTEEELEDLRRRILDRLAAGTPLPYSATLWGWNYGFDQSASGYRLHASHQQIHQQFALLPATVAAGDGKHFPAYGCGDLIADFCAAFRSRHGKSFFSCYLAAIAANVRTDGRNDLPASLVVHEDDHVLLFVPKAQTSQWELQLVCRKPVGNILEADGATRRALDRSIRTAIRTLASLGARMITSIEFPKRFDTPDRDQLLLYSFLPKLPQSMGAFSEAQLRFINGHYPEDFAAACRKAASRLAP
ncbi:MAG: hypothetical protein AB1568_05905 [Thermodesulfobacteriota bacterium]